MKEKEIYIHFSIMQVCRNNKFSLVVDIKSLHSKQFTVLKKRRLLIRLTRRKSQLLNLVE